MEMECHEISNAFPLMQGREFDELCEDVARNGLIHPIVTLDDKILDGRNRYRACIKVEIEPRFTTYGAKLNPIDFVISANLVRRMLTQSQKAAAAGELANMQEGRPGKTWPNGHVNTQISLALAAEKLGVSKRQVVRATAVKKADPDLFQQVKDGKVSVGKAEATVRAKKKEEDNRRRAHQQRAKDRYEAAKQEMAAVGQVPAPPKFKPEKTVDDRILAAINSGQGLVNAVKDVEEAEDLGFSDEHLRSLIQLLDTEIKNRRAMKRALEAHSHRRKM